MPLFNAIDGFLFRYDEVTDAAPHLRDANNLKRMFIIVVFAALPSALTGIYFFGWRGFMMILVSYTVGLSVEITFSVIRKTEISEGAFVTCLLFPLILPPDLPLWMVGLGIFVATLFGKEVFGGTGYNIFNPALVGRVFLYVCFPTAMSWNWVQPMSGMGGFASFRGESLGELTGSASSATPAADVVTMATPMAAFPSAEQLPSLVELFLGNIAGSLGETSALMIILGGTILVVTRIADWRIPLSFITSASIFSFLLHLNNPAAFPPLGYQLLSGGLLFGAFFMATDPVTSPFSKPGRWVFGAMCGFLTILIRGFSGYPEGVMFAILFMNLFTPLIDHLVLHFRFRGHGR
ncbi:MAG: RnfABCDGE type electron transport complex subunit D [Proteobacteria bacterium]|nr:RnfABCDGE type electron transport complex subunit D [Pseudomonadota bacterium]